MPGDRAMAANDHGGFSRLQKDFQNLLLVNDVQDEEEVVRLVCAMSMVDGHIEPADPPQGAPGDDARLADIVARLSPGAETLGATADTQLAEMLQENEVLACQLSAAGEQTRDAPGESRQAETEASPPTQAQQQTADVTQDRRIAYDMQMEADQQLAESLSDPDHAADGGRLRLEEIVSLIEAGGNAGEETYEELLELGERLGEVKRRGVTADQLAALPTSRYRPAAAADDADATECKVCYGEFQTDEVLRTLPCCHRYHAACIDKWIKTNAICPVCRLSVTME